MTGDFKLVRKISFLEPHYSKTPIIFENVYVDRFNSIFGGFYFLKDADSIPVEKLGPQVKIKFKKLYSTERFGFSLKASDIVSVDIVSNDELTEDQKVIIAFLNRCINEKHYIEEKIEI